jgi:hypothetical protein
MAAESRSERHPSSDAEADEDEGEDEDGNENAVLHTGASLPNSDMEIEPRVPVI